MLQYSNFLLCLKIFESVLAMKVATAPCVQSVHPLPDFLTTPFH
jgi:hypothetical protein